jgi:transposase
LDEARFGLTGKHRRRWCPSGKRPPWEHEDRYQGLWLYAAVEPASGDSFVLFLPRTDGACRESFLSAFRHAVPEPTVGLVLDNSGSHGKARVDWPKGITKLSRPPYSPELNPAERWVEERRKSLAKRVFTCIAELEEAVTEALRPYWDDPDKLVRLTTYPWWKEGTSELHQERTRH